MHSSRLALRLVTLAAFSVTLPVTLRGQIPVAAPPPNIPEIVVTGTGVIRLPADRARASIEIGSFGETGATALGANTALTDRVRQALVRSGVARSAITVQALSVSPVAAPNSALSAPPFEARTTLGLTIADPQTVGATLAAALSAGATRITSVTFISDTLIPTRRVALAEAFKLAQGEAFALAIAGGGRLGALRSMTVMPTTAHDNTTLHQARSDSGISVPLTPEVVVTMTVEVRWEFVPR